MRTRSSTRPATPLFILAIFITLHPVWAGPIQPTLINGTPVATDTWKEVVYISSSGGSCSATLVGPRVLITAAHCATTGSTVTFTLDSKKYSAKMTRSSLYPGKDHDISVGLISEEVKNVKPKTIGGAATKGLEITLLGYGCIQEGGGGGNDGILRIGKSIVTGFSSYDMISTTPGGAALCFGDSGGPAFVADRGEDGAVLLGINSKGDIATTNYNTRLDSTESQTFLKNYATTNGVDICGINVICKDDPQPTDPPATCRLTANPQSVFIGESVTLSLNSTTATSADIDGVSVSVPVGERRVTASSLGANTVRAHVSGPGGAGQCETTYTVADRPSPNRPTCTLSAVPQQVRSGETVSLELVSQGAVDFASIDGVSVSVPSGKRVVTTRLLGDFSSNGFVRGTGGSANCFADYKVVDGGTPPPPTAPSYAVAPAACGTNSLSSSGVREVCIGVIKKSDASETLKVQNALLISYTDGTKEVMPLLATKSLSSDATTQKSEEQWTFYTNKTLTIQNFQVLDTKTATVTKRTSDGAFLAIEGRSAAGRYFIVDNMTNQALTKK